MLQRVAAGVVWIMLMWAGSARAQSSLSTAPVDSERELLYPDVVDRPLLLPRGLHEASLELSTTAYDDPGPSLFDFIETPLQLRLGIGTELDLGVTYLLGAPDGYSASRLLDASFAVRVPMGSRRNALTYGFGARYPTEDFVDLRVGIDFALRRKAMPKLAIEGHLGALYDILPDSDPLSHAVAMVFGMQADYQIMPLLAASLRTDIGIPVFTSDDRSGDATLGIFMRGSYTLYAIMIDFYSELGFPGGDGGPVQFMVGVAARFP